MNSAKLIMRVVWKSSESTNEAIFSAKGCLERPVGCNPKVPLCLTAIVCIALPHKLLLGISHLQDSAAAITSFYRKQSS